MISQQLVECRHVVLGTCTVLELYLSTSLKYNFQFNSI